MNIKADFVKRKMLEKEITQKELGELLGNNTSGQQVVNAMLRRGSCSEQVAFKLCEILKCTIGELKAPPDIESKFIKASGQLEKEKDDLMVRVQMLAQDNVNRQEIIDMLKREKNH